MCLWSATQSCLSLPGSVQGQLQLLAHSLHHCSQMRMASHLSNHDMPSKTLRGQGSRQKLRISPKFVEGDIEPRHRLFLTVTAWPDCFPPKAELPNRHVSVAKGFCIFQSSF